MIDPVDCPGVELRRSSVLASLLVLALAACGPTATSSQEDTGTQTTSSGGTGTQTANETGTGGSLTTDDSSAGPDSSGTHSAIPTTSGPGSTTDPGSTWSTSTSTSTSGSTTDPGSTWSTSTSTSETPSTSTSGTTTSGSCATIACAPCYLLDEQECSCCMGNAGEDPVCAPLYGDRLDRDQGCLEQQVLAVCANAICLGMAAVYQDADGDCWLFGGDCLGEGYDAPPGWTYDSNGDLCPELADGTTDPLLPC